ncbi:myb-like protein X [Aplysia californica]|uniref:Myb-like protein X n=1 Tax=Aplysia californica TaxID=6500 RepID=A0ABM0JNQ0_APLCA|nr:myb-like protein X [Aplysia californica]XP_005097966.1 myb-like protein X [Aplysia californica]
MGNCVSLLKRKKEPNKAITLAIIGLDNAGKTTLCSVFTGETPDPDIAPTVGFRNVKFSHSNFDVTLFDVGGGKSIRPIWKTYFGEVFGIMYVLDSSSRANLLEAREVLRDALEHPQISGKPILVLANKVDKDDHLEEVDIVHGLKLEETANANNCPSHLVMVSALVGVGTKMDKELQDGLQWLLEKIRGSLSELEPRVASDIRAATERRDKEREERKARVQRQREEREKEEERERRRLGTEKEKEDSEDDDIVDGNPFKALDMDTLKQKEQRLKEEKRRKQERMRELDLEDGRFRRSKDDSSLGYASGVRRSLDDYQLESRAGGREESSGNNYAALNLFGRGANSRASALPPLEPLGSRVVEGAEKKKPKKKKKLTDYHLDDRDEEGEFGHAEKRDAIGRLGLNVHDLDSLNRDHDVHDLTPRVTKPKKNNKVVRAGRIDEHEEEDDPYRDLGVDGRSRYKNLASLRQNNYEDVLPAKRGNKDMGRLNNNDRFPRDLERENSLYRNSLKKISPPNMTRFEEDEEDDKDEGIEEDSDNGSDDAVDKYRRSRNVNGVNRNRKSRDQDVYSSRDRKLRGQSRDSDDEEERDDYLSHSILKDTMRFPTSPTDDEVPVDFRKEMERLRNRKVNDYRSKHNGIDSDNYSSSRQNAQRGMRRYDDDEEDKLGNARNRNARNVRSPMEDEEDFNSVRHSGQSETRRKKKKNLLRSNKLAPSDDDENEPPSSHRFSSPRMVQEHGSRNTSDADTPTRHGRNVRTTHIHRQDSDFGMKWGLAEELPTVDSNYNVTRMRHPNFDDSDGGDVVF